MDLILALDNLERALAREPGFVQARFNRGLALERLGFCTAAESAWRDYLAMDRQSAWAREAWNRRAGMPCERPDWSRIEAWAAGKDEELPEALDRILALAPVDVLRRSLDDLLPAWAEAYLADDSAQADRRLSRLRHLGAELRSRAKDETVWRSIRRLEEAGPADRRRLAQAHVSFGEGARLRAASLYSRAQESYRRAVRLGGDPSAPVVLWAQYGVFSTLVTESKYQEARKVASELRSSLDLAVLPALAARIAWSEGLILLRTGAFAESRQSFDAASALFERMGDSTQRGATRALAAESLHALGLGEEAWQARREAFHALGSRPSGPLHNLLIDSALASREEGWGYAALLFQTAGLEGARTLGSVSWAVEALLWRSKVLVSLGRTDEALADLRAALAQAPDISDPGIRSRLTADVQEAHGGLLLDRDPAAAIPMLSEAIAFYRKTEYAWKLPSVLLLRARARLRRGEVALAETDLEAALEEFERRDRAMPPEIFRYSHFERAQETFEEMMRLQLTRHRPELALSYLERARRASWPVADRNTGPEAGRDTEVILRQAVAELPQGHAVIEYAVLDGRLLTWVLHDGRMRFLDRPIDGLPGAVASFMRALSARSSPEAHLARKAEALHDELVAPWIHELPPGAHLHFVPDRFLHGLAFAALRDPERRRWLSQDFIVSTTPSLRFAVGIDRGDRSLRSGGGSALLVGNPRFDPSETGRLDDLPGAVEEIRRIAPLHPGATVLTDAEAHKDRVLAVLAEADTFHYSGHALSNRHNPWVSFLALARPAEGRTGLLLASDIHSLPHRLRRLAVLSACGSASKGQLRSAGFAPLVSSFLAIGFEDVVASLWSVEDREVLPLALDLHQGLRRGLPVAEALHRARLRLIERSPAVSPHIWASLQVTGRIEHQTVFQKER